ncbi:MAG: hypothetical protein LBN05_03795 [Oscillospiraceae bacterium]|jgi:hypothetical protein|nr:hypothetical protein [Oscillospiraceae bacterium]
MTIEEIQALLEKSRALTGNDSRPTPPPAASPSDTTPVYFAPAGEEPAASSVPASPPPPAPAPTETPAVTETEMPAQSDKTQEFGSRTKKPRTKAALFGKSKELTPPAPPPPPEPAPVPPAVDKPDWAAVFHPEEEHTRIAEVAAPKQSIEPLELPSDETKKPPSFTTPPLYTEPKAPTDDIDDEINGAQLVLEGFYQKEKPPVQVEEHEAEKQLHRRRKEKINTFPKNVPLEDVWSGAVPEEDEDSEEEPPPAEFEYTDPADRDSINHDLLATARSTAGRAKLSGGLLALGLVLTLLSWGGELGSALGFENHLLSMTGNLMCLALFGFLCAHDIGDGLARLFRWKGDSDSAIGVAYVLSLVVGLLPLLPIPSLGTTNQIAFTLPLLLAGFLNQVAKNATVQNLAHSFGEWAILHANALFAVHPLTSKSDEDELRAGVHLKSAPILVSQQIAFPKDFCRESGDNPPLERLFRWLIPISLGISVLVSVALFLRTGAMATSLATLPALSIALLPFALFAAQTLPMRRVRQQLQEDKAMLASVPAAQKIASAGAYALDGVELFDRANCALVKFLPAREAGANLATIMTYAAAMLREMDGPALEAFRRQMNVPDADIPKVREVCSHEKLGISAKLPHGSFSDTVLLGTLRFLSSHSVAGLPDGPTEQHWEKRGFRPLYLSFAGQYQATVVFRYKPARFLQRISTLAKFGLQLLVCTRDPNITERGLLKQFSLTQPGAVCIASPRGEVAFQRYRLLQAPSAPAAALHDGSAHSYLSLILAAHRIDRAARRTNFAQLVLLVAAAVFFSVALLMGLEAITAVLILFGVQVLGTVVLLLLGRA